MTFDDFVHSLGIRPRGPIQPDGKWHRCPTDDKPRGRNGAFKLQPDGRVGFAQNWAVHESPVTWFADKGGEAPAYDPAEARRRAQEAQRAQDEARAKARAFYESCRRLNGSHPYLDAKCLTVQGCAEVRLSPKGWLVVPAYRDGAIQSVQCISPEGKKLFWKGAGMAGTAFVIARKRATVNVLAEGVATGLAVYQAVPECRVWVLWGTGNLANPPCLPRGLTVIAADNDHETAERIGKNPGIEAGKKAAEAIGCGIAWPEGIEGTDWADYRIERLAEATERKGRWDTESKLRRQVDAQLKSELMRRAVFVS